MGERRSWVAGLAPAAAALLIAANATAMVASASDLARPRAAASAQSSLGNRPVRADRVPSDPLYPSQTNLPRIGMPAAWDRTVGSPSILVAVLDTGVDLAHEDLAGQGTYAPGLSPGAHVFVTSPSSGCPTPTTPDDDGWRSPTAPTARGTHLAGIIAANSTLAGGAAVGVTGVAPGARVVPFKVLDCAARGSFADLAVAVSVAAGAGARVILLPTGVAQAAACPASLQGAINDAVARGATVVAGAGDDGMAVVTFPAGCGNTLAAAATDANDGPAGLSQFNATVDLAAPGVAVLSTTRDANGSRGYGTLSSTGAAAAHVAGCAALLRSLNGSLLPGQIETILRTTAVDLGAPGRDDQFGSGRIDCGAAVAQVAGAAATPTAPASATPTPTTASQQSPVATATATSGGVATMTRTPTATVTRTPPVLAATLTPTAPVISAHTPTLAPASNPVAGARRFEDNSPAVSYSGSWQERFDANASAGHYRAVRTELGASAQLTFATTGGTVTWATLASGGGGAADVFLNGEYQHTVDLYAPNSQYWLTFSYAITTPGTHALHIVARDPSLLSPTHLDVVVDYFDVVDAPTPPPTPPIPPTQPPPPPASRTPTNTRTPTSTRTPAPGTSTPSPSATEVEPTPTEEGTPGPTPPPAPTSPGAPGRQRFEDNSASISYSAGWTQALEPGASVGHYRRTSQIGAAASFTFTGQGGAVAWGLVRGPLSGKADVSLDGVFLDTVDLYAPAPTFGQQVSYQVAPGRHVLRVTVRGDAHPSAAGLEIGVDFFEVVEPVGGKGFGIRREPGSLLQTVVATWSPGTAQAGYLLARMSPTSTLLLPFGGTQIRPDAITFSDISIFTDPVYCYALLPMGPSSVGPIGRSDVLCTLSSQRTGIAPTGFTLRLNESSEASLNWQAPSAFLPVAADYWIVAVGPSPTVIPVPAGTLQVTHDTRGAPTCYVVVAVVASEAIGASEVLCGLPGLSRL